MIESYHFFLTSIDWRFNIFAGWSGEEVLYCVLFVWSGVVRLGITTSTTNTVFCSCLGLSLSRIRSRGAQTWRVRRWTSRNTIIPVHITRIIHRWVSNLWWQGVLRLLWFGVNNAEPMSDDLLRDGWLVMNHDWWMLMLVKFINLFEFFRNSKRKTLSSQPSAVSCQLLLAPLKFRCSKVKFSAK